jgi:DsbC/DsbD-like thiol-disulfide interchange protein
MTIAMRLLQIAVLGVAALASGVVWAAGASSWHQGFHSRVRLIAGGERGGQVLAGIQIVLDDGFKTYWRTPGEAGLPPRFDWSGSRNAAAFDIRWPAPTRTEDAGGVAYGYGAQVILPVLVTPVDPAQPVELSLKLDFGVCKDICIPAQAELNLALSGETGTHRAAIERALAVVPRQQALGADRELAILEAKPFAGEKPSLSVRVRAPAGAKPVLFAEGPDDWYLSTTPAPESESFTVTVDERPKDASGKVLLRLTLVAGDEAIETELRLDAGGQPR